MGAVRRRLRGAGRPLVLLHGITLSALARYHRITQKDELADGMKTALETDGVVLVDVHVSKEENCYPMIPAGQAARDMVG